jgi:hypothetical protein
MLGEKQPAGNFLSLRACCVYGQIEKQFRKLVLPNSDFRNRSESSRKSERAPAHVVPSPVQSPSKEKRKHCILDQSLIDTLPIRRQLVRRSHCAIATDASHPAIVAGIALDQLSLRCQVSASNCRGRFTGVSFESLDFDFYLSY